MNLEERKKKIIYIINDLSFFVSHRLPLALHAKSKKWNVKILIGKPGSKIMESKVLVAQWSAHASSKGKDDWFESIRAPQASLAQW